MTDSDVYALVLAGGRGARFWPLSRRARPKQCLSLDGGPSLLQSTIDRLQPLIAPARVTVVTGPDMAALVRSQAAQRGVRRVLVEPSARNTAPCVAWGATEIAREHGRDAVIVVLPADHGVARPEVLRDALAEAARVARAEDALVTLGIQPDRPATGFGYLALATAPNPGSGPIGPPSRVERFVEKPPLAQAQVYVDGGRHLWNAGIFVFRAGRLLDELAHALPRTADAMAAVADDPASLQIAWPETDAISLDYGVMERATDVWTVPCDPGWSDLGAWDQVEEHLPAVDGGRGLARTVVSVDSEDCVVHALDKAVALVGLRGVIVVDTPDALLVLERARAQEVRAVLQQLQDRGLDDLL